MRVGAYQIRNVAPGSYRLEVDSTTLPADYRVPARTSWVVVVRALENFYLDIPVFAQRAIAGVVFVDKDGNGKFDPEKDEPVQGAHVIAGSIEAITVKSGAYILRGLPPGRIDIRTRSTSGVASQPIIVELSAEPVTRRGVNLAVIR